MTVTATVACFARIDLENALGRQIVSAVYDDDGNLQADLAPLAACIQYGSSECLTWLRANNYEEHLPKSTSDVPDALRFAALEFGIAYTMRRRPDVVRAMNGESWTTFMTTAIDKMKNYAATLQRLPRETSVPANVGATVGENGEVTSRPASSASCHRSRVFDDMGDF